MATVDLIISTTDHLLPELDALLGRLRRDVVLGSRVWALLPDDTRATPRTSVLILALVDESDVDLVLRHVDNWADFSIAGTSTEVVIRDMSPVLIFIDGQPGNGEPAGTTWDDLRAALVQRLLTSRRSL